MTEIFGFNAYSPKEIAERVETVGVAKARLSLLSMIMLGVLAGVDLPPLLVPPLKLEFRIIQTVVT